MCSFFNELGIPEYPVSTGLPISIAIEKYPILRNHLASKNPPRLNRTNRDALLCYNYYVAKELYDLDIKFEPSRAIIPTPVMRYSFLFHLFDTPEERTKSKLMIEIGTGASAVIAMLAAKHFNAHVVATEIDTEYLQFANRNIHHNHLQSRIQLLDSQGNFLHGVVDDFLRVDYIISNPPYYDKILSPKHLWGGKSHELVGNGDRGEEFIIRMIEEGFHFLKPTGILAFIIPKTRSDTLVAVEEYLATREDLDYDIFGIIAGNRTRYVFRIYKVKTLDTIFHSEFDY